MHLLTDGDTVFALATGGRTLDPANPIALNDLLAAGAEAVTRAIVKAVRAATGVNGSEGGGTYLSYSDLYDAQRHSRQPEGSSSPETESPST